MQVRWLSLVLALTPLVVNADQNDVLPEIELLEFLGSYSSEDQIWLELAMEEEQQLINSNRSTTSVGDSKND